MSEEREERTIYRRGYRTRCSLCAQEAAWVAEPVRPNVPLFLCEGCYLAQETETGEGEQRRLFAGDTVDE